MFPKRKWVVWLSIFLSLSLTGLSSVPSAEGEETKPAVEEVRATQPPPYTGPSTDSHRELAKAIEKAQVAQYLEAVHQAELEKQAAAKKKIPKALSTSSPSGGSHRGYATARECVSMVEHGGSYSESNNPSHKGRYQFSRSAWISFGGVPEHWDNWELATPAEQDEVFNNAWSQGPATQTQQWLKWDGCGPPDGS